MDSITDSMDMDFNKSWKVVKDRPLRVVPSPTGLPSMRVARGSASWLSSHGRGLGRVTQEPKHLIAASEVGVGGSAPKATSRDHVAPRGPPRGKAAAPGTKADCVCFPSVGSALCPVSLGLSSLWGGTTKGQRYTL